MILDEEGHALQESAQILCLRRFVKDVRRGDVP